MPFLLTVVVLEAAKCAVHWKMDMPKLDCALLMVSYVLFAKQGLQIDPDSSQALRLEFARSNTKASSTKQHQQQLSLLQQSASFIHPAAVQQFIGCKSTLSSMPATVFFMEKDWDYIPSRTPNGMADWNGMEDCVQIACSVEWSITYCCGRYYR